jgi:transposase InsO family protein
MIAELKEKHSLPISSVVRQLGLSYTTFMRWKRRFAKGRPAVAKPGPKKVRPLDLGELEKEISNLKHGKKRSHGAGRLHDAFNKAISRRELNQMIRKVRDENRRQQAAGKCSITWLKPNLAWAMDGCQRPTTVGSERLHLHNLSDLCSRYKFNPLASASLPCGEEVAGHLSHLFSRFGAPLFCKRDNGGNLNHSAVNDVLEEAFVIPINSPPCRAPYNGAIEHTQGEFKGYLRYWEWKASTIDEFNLLAETAAHDLNHQSRRCLNGQTACSVYFGDGQIRYDKRRRKSIYDWIRDLAAEISIQAGKTKITATAWRVAAKQWLVKNGLIQIQKAGNVLPNFS